VTDVERQTALEAIAAEVRVCTNCRLHETRTRAVPGEGAPDTEVVFVGEGPGFNEDRQGRPFVGRAGDLLVKLLGSIGWRREDVFITNTVQCRPPDNRDRARRDAARQAPSASSRSPIRRGGDAGAPPMGRFPPGARIAGARPGAPADPRQGRGPSCSRWATAAALRTPAIERDSYADAATIPAVLLDARARRADHASTAAQEPTEDPSQTAPIDETTSDVAAPPPDAATATADTDQMTLF
jgi:DNA polymerase